MIKATKRILCLLVAIVSINNTLLAQTPLEGAIIKALPNARYLICLDGGGSKTELQVLDCHGNIVAIEQNGNSGYAIKAGGSNINVVGKDGVKKTFDALFGNLTINHTALASLAPQCVLVGGFSGAGSAEAKSTIKSLCTAYNFDANNIVIASDADMALAAIEGDGIILISGTGSICFGKKGTEVVRVGGLGRFIGDEGSGYAIGIRALKAALENEYGWGDATALKGALRTYFNVADLKAVIAPFYRSEITNYQIAALAPTVFAQAEMGDRIAATIVHDAMQELGTMVARMIQHGKFTPCPINFFGGVFKSKNADQCIQKILQAAHVDDWTAYNRAMDNPTVLAVQRLQKTCLA